MMCTSPAARADDKTELVRIELPRGAVEGTIIKFTLPDGRRARTTVPDLSKVAGWPDDRVLCVRVPKPPPPPPGTSSKPAAERKSKLTPAPTTQPGAAVGHWCCERRTGLLGIRCCDGMQSCIRCCAAAVCK